jgi:hypothetical protein
VAECDAYAAAFTRYASCDKVPQQAKDAAKSAMDQMRQGWSALGAPDVAPAARQAAADSCKTAMGSLQQSASALGCTI